MVQSKLSFGLASSCAQAQAKRRPSPGLIQRRELPPGTAVPTPDECIRTEPAWKGRAESKFGNQKPVKPLKMHFTCAGIDAPGRSMMEYKVP